METHPHVIVYRHIAAHAPITAAALASGVGLDLAAIERALAVLLAVGLIEVARGHLNGQVRYAPLEQV